MNFLKIRDYRLRTQQGFTLAELVVVAGIIAVISSIILTNYNAFGSNILLGNLAYDVALSIRQAQVYGISTREAAATCTNPGDPSPFFCAYGVAFNMTTAAQIPNYTSYLFYADTSDDDGTYTLNLDTVVQTIQLPPGYAISKICVPSTGGDCTVVELNVTFKRPNPEARLIAKLASGAVLVGSAAPTAFIELVSQNGKTRSITVQDTGQISISPL